MNSRGFTLVEMLIAVLIAAFLLAAVWTSFLLGSFNVKCARHTSQGVDLCEAGIEIMQGKTQAELQALDGITTSEELSLDYSEDKSNAIMCTRTTTLADTDGDNVYEVTVTVSWIERYLGGTKTRTVVFNTEIAKTSMSGTSGG